MTPSRCLRGEEAMYHTQLGDDVFGEDPTVNRLEEMAAGKIGADMSGEHP